MTTPNDPAALEERAAPPAREPARSSREIVERVILQLSRLPARVDRGPVVAAMGRTLAALAGLVKSEIDDPDHLDLLRSAVAASGEAHGEMLTAEAGTDAGLAKSLAGVHDALAALVEPTIQLVVSRQEKVIRRRAEAPPRKPELTVFQSCAGAPRLFTYEREPLSLSAFVRVAPLPGAGRIEEADELEKDATNTALDDEDEASESAPRLGDGGAGSKTIPDTEPGAPAGEVGSLEQEIWGGDDFEDESEEARELHGLRRLARDTAEEVGSLGMLRSPTPNLPNTPWAIGAASFEARLLENLDALMALAEPYHSGGSERRFDPLSALLAWSGDAMVPDPTRAFARAFVLGCVAGEDTAALAVMSLRKSHTLTYEAQRDALSLCPHPGIVPEIERMITEETPALVREGLAILERRRQAAFESVAPLLSHPEASVRAGAARCLGAAAAPQAAGSLLLQHLSSEEDDAVLAAAAESLVVLGSRRGLELARAKLTEEAQFPAALPKGVRADLLRLLGIAGGPSDLDLLLASLGHDPLAATALGFLGDAVAIPAMLQALVESHGNPKRWAFSCALARSLHRITGLGRPALGDPKVPVWMVDPPVDPEFWARVWSEKRDAMGARRKYRFGSLYSPQQTAQEAATPELTVPLRRDVLLELSVASRGQSRAHALDWVARQEQALSEVREHFRKSAYPEGQFVRTALLE
ncbi:MAG: hypothetical protein U0441_13095 [Polyangiaceae bacterium]